MDRLRDFTQELELRHKALAGISLRLARDPLLYNNADEALVQRGASRYVKGGDVVTTGDFGATPAPTSAALAALVNAEDLLGRLLGAIRLPLTMPGRLQVGAMGAAETAEGAAAPIAALTFGAAGKPVKIEGLVVLANEVLRAVDAATQEAVLQMLVASCALASDREAVSVFTAGTPTSTATVAAIFAALDKPAKPYLLTSLGDLLDLPAGTVRDLQAAGVSVLTSPAAAGTLIALDASGVLISDSGVEVRTARHATLNLDLTGGSPANPVPVSLFQSDLTALGGLRYLRVSVREGAAAFATVTP